MAGFLKTLFSKRSGVVATGNLTVTDDFWYSVGGGSSSSGAVVSKESAMRQWAVYACVTEIAETLAQLPLKLKRPNGSGGTEDATDHPLYHLCKNEPNPQMTSFNWREAQQGNLLSVGNSYNFIQRTRFGVKGIESIDPTAANARLASGKEIDHFRLSKNDRIVYEVQTSTGKITYQSKDILHIPGFGFNGLKGESIISVFAKESIGNAITLDHFQGKAMKNGYFPSGVFEHPDTLGDNKAKFIEALDGRFSGPENARRPMVLENGMQFKKTDVSMVDKQFIEQMKMSANMICGVFKVPPHRIGVFEKNTNYNNTEQGNKSFLDGCMMQWVTRWEKNMDRKLLSPEEKKAGYAFKFNFDALLRPDAKTRSEIQWREWQTGVPLNEIRKTNDQNPIDGGDVSYIPANMIPSHLAGVQVQSNIDKQEGLKDELVDDDVNSLRNLERNAVTREIKKATGNKDHNSFCGCIDTLYAKLFDKLEGRTRKTIRCFNSESKTNQIISDLKDEFVMRREKIIEAHKSGFADIEEVWNG